MIWLSHLHMLEEYPEILTIGEVAEILRVTRLTLKRWEQKGLIQPIRINSRGDRRYTKKQILALLGQ
ncbi:MerR family transcriptional regulator [bacterium]|nr:MerR family transcriptional regulator [bacterium]